MSSDVKTEARQALDVLWELRPLLKRSRKADWQAVLHLLEPYRERQYLDGATRENSNRILSLINATIGDAYRELGEPRQAATAYGRAQDFFPGTGFQDLYAELVLKHRLEEHYEKALTALVAGHRTWSARPAIIRLAGHVGGLLTNPRTYWRYLRGRLLFSRRVRELRARIDRHTAARRGQ